MYIIIGRIFGLIAFLGAWLACSVSYGFIGFAAGWIPSIVLAGIAAAIWPVLLICLIVFLVNVI